ncbi:hypothetical protein BVG16_13395 [Paenibacillus selenitireducens]|uniref:Uncharacterized protein n=1 Tax=Paenibacillus selenitireducens TaxID=1324314 RepID=A0A1T2XC94_9BACL|nr:hypothetical protein BVG16_13395 [Paenibacillus selenitireducens]
MKPNNELVNRLFELIVFYRQLSAVQNPDGTWDWFLWNEIQEIGREVFQSNENMASLPGRHIKSSTNISITVYH